MTNKHGRCATRLSVWLLTFIVMKWSPSKFFSLPPPPKDSIEQLLLFNCKAGRNGAAHHTLFAHPVMRTLYLHWSESTPKYRIIHLGGGKERYESSAPWFFPHLRDCDFGSSRHVQ